MQVFGKKDSNYLYQTGVTFESIEKSAELAAALADHGYPAERIQVGLTLHGEVSSIFKSLIKTRRKKTARGKKVREIHAEVYKRYMGRVHRLRKELVENPEICEELGLNGLRNTSIASFIEEANHFYNTALEPDIAPVILPFGFTTELLQGDLDQLAVYQTARNNYEKLMGECQKMTVEKDKAFKRLRQWMSALVAAGKEAFANNLQTLEEMGFFVRNKPKPKKVDADNDGTPDTEGDNDDTTGSEGSETSMETIGSDN